MEKYAIYCNEEQTKKARELGAPIEIKSIEEAPKDWQGKAFFTGMSTCAKLPTAEQMIGYLEEEFNLHFLTGIDIDDLFFFHIYDKYELILEPKSKPSRKDATLAAIDAALEYLTKNK